MCDYFIGHDTNALLLNKYRNKAEIHYFLYIVYGNYSKGGKVDEAALLIRDLLGNVLK